MTVDSIAENPPVKSAEELTLATNAIKTIETSEEKLNTTDPVSIVESTVADFLQKAIDATLCSNQLSRSIEQSLIADLPSMSTNEKLTLYNIERSSSNDTLGKLLQPTIGLITARQQSIIQAAAKESASAAAMQVNIGVGNNQDSLVASATSPEVVTGLNTIFQLIASRNPNNASKE